MPSYIRKNKAEILREALRKLQLEGTITATSPGSIARAFVEAVTSELGDAYDIMDFNLNQNLLSTATGSALDALGSLYGIERKTINNLAAIDKQIGAFMFYIQSPFSADIVIPKGTNVYTDTSTYTGQRFSYSTTEDAVILSGRTRVYASIKPNFTDSVFTAGINTLKLHDYTSPVGTVVLCSNPKSIPAQQGYEDDEAYRVRIMKSNRLRSAGTLEAVRFAGLSVSGVRDIRIRQAPFGMGSFEAVIVPETNGNANQAVANATNAMNAVRPLGVKMYTKRPTEVAFDISIDLVIPLANVSAIVDNVLQRAKIGIARYINSLLPGNPIVYNRLIQIILDSSELVKDVIIKTYSINGTEIVRRNYTPAEDQQIVPGNIVVNIASSV